ncbi:MAG: hypothetical protein AB1744_03450 [Candidatus Zixiibacteriota bacterium]
MSNSTRQDFRVQIMVFVAYYATLTFFLLASFFPEYRVWGVNWWAYYPLHVKLGLFLVGAVVPWIILWMSRLRGVETEESTPLKQPVALYYLIVGCLIVLFGLAFYFSRTRTHFLGDGYTVLSLLAQKHPLLKTREIGEALVHVWVKSLVGGGEAAALASFRILSIGAGLVFLTIVALVGARLFDRLGKRLLFLIGLASGGYMLLFFGYVENYSLFACAVAAYTLVGVLVALGRVNRWIIVIPLGLTIFLHVLGATLIPSAFYLLVSKTRIGVRLARQSQGTKILLGTIGVLIVAAIFAYYYTSDYFFRFAFLPLLENRFTVEGYTLFSLKHLADFANLILLLFPGSIVFLIAVSHRPVRSLLRQCELRFLLILLVSSWGATFVLDPKLGMPRDWDLFAFSGVPLTVISLALMSYVGAWRSFVMSLCVALNFLSLGPRVMSQTVEHIAIAHFNEYAQLDEKKNRNSRRVLIDYHRDRGHENDVVREQDLWRKDFPEDAVADSALALLKRGQYAEAATMFHGVVQQNPLLSDAWLNLGKCYVYLNRHNEAFHYTRIANALNPYNAEFMSDLGTVYGFLGDRKNAELWLLRALSVDTIQYMPLINLLHMYAEWGETKKYDNWFDKLLSFDTESVSYIAALTETHLRRRDYLRAARCLEVALHWGADSTYVTGLLERHRGLRLEYARLKQQPN